MGSLQKVQMKVLDCLPAVFPSRGLFCFDVGLDAVLDTAHVEGWNRIDIEAS